MKRGAEFFVKLAAYHHLLDQLVLERVLGFRYGEIPIDVREGWQALGVAMRPSSFTPLFSIQPRSYRLAYQQCQELGYSVPAEDGPPASYDLKVIEMLKALGVDVDEALDWRPDPGAPSAGPVPPVHPDQAVLGPTTTEPRGDRGEES